MQHASSQQHSITSTIDSPPRRVVMQQPSVASTMGATLESAMTPLSPIEVRIDPRSGSLRRRPPDAPSVPAPATAAVPQYLQLRRFTEPPRQRPASAGQARPRSTLTRDRRPAVTARPKSARSKAPPAARAAPSSPSPPARSRRPVATRLPSASTLGSVIAAARGKALGLTAVGPAPGYRPPSGAPAYARLATRKQDARRRSTAAHGDDDYLPPEVVRAHRDALAAHLKALQRSARDDAHGQVVVATADGGQRCHTARVQRVLADAQQYGAGRAVVAMRSHARDCACCSEELRKAAAPGEFGGACCSACIYCGNPIATYAARCHYCLRKPPGALDTVAARVGLKRLGKRVLEAQPKTTASDLLDTLCEYGASDASARRINGSLRLITRIGSCDQCRGRCRGGELRVAAAAAANCRRIFRRYCHRRRATSPSPSSLPRCCRPPPSPSLCPVAVAATLPPPPPPRSPRLPPP